MRKKAQPSPREGLSIAQWSMVLFLAATLAIVFSVVELRQTMMHAQSLYELEKERQKCDKAIQQFMDGSDYLTAQVQQFVVKGERAYMDNYWTEVYETRSRDAALADILSVDITPEEREVAEASKRESDSLIEGEIWAMRIVSESLSIAVEDMPAEVAECRLGVRDAALSDAKKREAAVAYVFGPVYSTAKSAIRANVNAFRNEIANRYGEEAMAALENARNTSRHAIMGIAIFFLFLICSFVSFARQVVSPLVRFSRDLGGYENGRPIHLAENGALEIRRFARAFNTLYAQVEQNAAKLNRLGHVDYLTDVPNRASVTEYADGLIAQNAHPVGFLMIDIDNFKRFNDTYGHATGDAVLKRVAEAVCAAPLKEGGIAGRICGEEFVVVAKGADERSLSDIAQTILAGVRRIEAKDVALPAAADFHVTVSIGGMVWRGGAPADFAALLAQADKALYASKQSGKDKYTYFA